MLNNGSPKLKGRRTVLISFSVHPKDLQEFRDEPDKRKGIKDEANERSPGWATLKKLAAVTASQ
jgi:hypothetical protein